MRGYVVGQSSSVVIEDIVEEEEDKVSDIPFARFFQQYAQQIDWEWQLLAAVAYHESRFNPCAESKSGARGLMQIMPRTAERFGLNDSTIWIPEHNIQAGVRYISRLEAQFDFVGNIDERRKFVLASYNAGPAHVHDARRLARKYGDNPYRWHDVEKYLRLLTEEEFFTDSVVEHGVFDANESISYVYKVLRTYSHFNDTIINKINQN